MLLKMKWMLLYRADGRVDALGPGSGQKWETTRQTHSLNGGRHQCVLVPVALVDGEIAVRRTVVLIQFDGLLFLEDEQRVELLGDLWERRTLVSCCAKGYP